MLFLPYSADLGLARPPYVTHAIMALCLLLHYFQDSNRQAIGFSVQAYCASIQGSTDDTNPLDILRPYPEDCTAVLEAIHSAPDKDRMAHVVVEGYLKETGAYSREALDPAIAIVMGHYRDFESRAPRSLDAKLVYDPATPNPLRTITSALSHGDWSHVIGNLIFFFAFAPAVEVLVGNALRYLGLLALIALITDATYSVTTFLSGSPPIPTLGLSGVVMGTIGLSGYLMPNARIRTFVLVLARNVYIPAWMLALWYIGWDTYELFANEDNGGINLVAHVSGGVAGYLLGLFWLRDRREEAREELDDEVEYRRSLRADRFGIMSSSHSSRARFAEEYRQYHANREFNRFVDEFHRNVVAGRDSEAMELLLKDYDRYRESPEIYEDLFEQMRNWRRGQTFLNLGRIVITLLVQQRKYGRALAVAESCLEVTEAFVLANPLETFALVREAQCQHRYQLAYLLVRDAEARYGDRLDWIQCGLMEVELLSQRLNKREAARAVMGKMIKRAPVERKAQLAAFARMVA